MPLVNRVPTGLLALLDMKSQGENPRELAYQLTAVIDLLDFYLSPGRVIVADNDAPSIGENPDPQLSPVPGELWIVRHLCAHSSGDIAAAATLELVVGYSAIGGAFITLGDNSGTKTTGQRAQSSYGTPFILQPGDQLGYYVSVLTGAPGNVTTRASIAKLQI